MILTDREIRIALDCGQLEITPYPAEEAFSSTSVDLSLGEVGRIWKNTDGLTITPGEATYSYKKIVDTLSEQVQIQTFKLKQHSLLLAWTTEEIHLPNQSRIAARVEGKSSHARIGIGIHVIITAPTIHAGFRGPIQLEIFNFGPHTITLSPGMKICQLILEQTFGTPQKGYSGSFSNQRAV